MQELTLATQDVNGAPHGHAAAPTVLLIEDDPGLSRLVSEVLDEAGYRPVTIVDHDQIGAAVDRWQPKCVIPRRRAPGHGAGALVERCHRHPARPS